jgi:hypothetical protein
MMDNKLITIKHRVFHLRLWNVYEYSEFVTMLSIVSRQRNNIYIYIYTHTHTHTHTLRGPPSLLSDGYQGLFIWG